MHLIDKTITLNAFRASFKSKFTIIWGSVMFAITLLCFFLFALVQQGSTDMLGYSIIATSLLLLITVLVWNIVNLNSLFSANQELGIMNLEIRKGRTSKEIFLSRLLVNKTISLVYILVMMSLYAIIFAIFNKRDLTIFWMFLTYIPTDLFFTAIFLLFYSMGKYKLTIALSSVLLTLILFTPILQIISPLVTNYSADRQNIARIYSADRVLTLANKTYAGGVTPYAEPESFTHRLLTEAHFLNDPLDTTNAAEPNTAYTIKNAGNEMLANGLLFDESTILNNLWSELPSMSEAAAKPDQDLTIRVELKDTLLYQINDELKGELGGYQDAYTNSLYWDSQVTNSHYQSMINKLKDLNNRINQTFSQNFSNVIGFTDLVLSYAQGMLYNTNYDTVTIGGWNRRYVTVKEYLQRVATSNYLNGFTDLEFLEKKTLFENLSIAPELRLWNEIAYQLIRNALELKREDMNQVSQKLFSLTALIPWNVQFETWMFANPQLDFYEYCRLNTSNWMEVTSYWVWNNSHYYNADADAQTGELKPLNIRPTSFDSAASFKSFSIVGYEIAIAGMGIVFAGLAFLIFFKRLKK